MNLRANFDKNKKASRIKALREFTMKRLTDFFGEKDWKTAEIRYNENIKLSKHCCWTVSMRDWNKIVIFAKEVTLAIVEPYLWEIETKPIKIYPRQPIVTPYLWEIETIDLQGSTYCTYTVTLYLWVIETSILRCLIVIIYKFVEPYLWVIFCFCWTHCFIRILWIVSLIFKEDTNKKMLQLIKSWSFFVKKFWLQEVGMRLQWRRCCPREIREMLLIISVWKRMGVALMVCRCLSWRITGSLIMSR